MPFWDDLPHDTAATTRSSVVTDTDTAITPTGMTTDQDKAVKLFRAKAWRVPHIIRYVAGSDPLEVVIDRYINWWVRETQRLLLKILSGAFSDATVAAALENDIAIEDGVAAADENKIGFNEIENTIFKLGDQFGMLTGIFMHSVPFQRLRRLDLIDFVPTSEQNPLGAVPGMTNVVPMYMGKRIFVDDGATVVAGSTSGFKYHTYIFGTGAVAFENVPLDAGTPAIELYRRPDLANGGGTSQVITRRYMLIHPRGIKWAGTLTSGNSGPTDAQLEADNWTQAWLTKNIRITRLVTNG
jgi:hypothetical protein